MSKISNVLKKTDEQILQNNAISNDFDSQYKFGMQCYQDKDFKNADIWLDKAFHNKKCPIDKKDELRKILSEIQGSIQYPQNSVPYAKSKMTRGNNYSSGSWYKN